MLIQAIKTDFESARQKSESIAAQMSTADLATCKALIRSIKKIIKTRSASPLERLISLYVHQKCMMKANTHYLLYSCKKIMRRFMVLAKHRKGSQDEQRGYDIFGKISSANDANREHSVMFLKLLLYYISIWGRKFGISPNGKSSIFFTNYEALKKAGISFPVGNVEQQLERGQPSRASFPPQIPEIDWGSDDPVEEVKRDRPSTHEQRSRMSLPARSSQEVRSIKEARREEKRAERHSRENSRS